jgi:hypothetical protein
MCLVIIEQLAVLGGESAAEKYIYEKPIGANRLSYLGITTFQRSPVVFSRPVIHAVPWSATNEPAIPGSPPHYPRRLVLLLAYRRSLVFQLSLFAARFPSASAPLRFPPPPPSPRLSLSPLRPLQPPTPFASDYRWHPVDVRTFSSARTVAFNA